jgi:hypothetical protein
MLIRSRLMYSSLTAGMSRNLAFEQSLENRAVQTVEKMIALAEKTEHVTNRNVYLEQQVIL